MTPRNARRHWSADDAATAVELLASGVPPTKAARALGRTYRGLVELARSQGTTITQLRSGAIQVRTVQQAAALFGVMPPVVVRWIRDGWLVAARDDQQRRKTRHFRIHDTAIQALVDNRQTWMRWDPARITDPEWRDYAEEQRAAAGGRWLSTPEIAARLGYSRHTVTDWIGRGKLSTVRVGRAHYVWSVDLAGWTPPNVTYTPERRRDVGQRMQADRRAA